MIWKNLLGLMYLSALAVFTAGMALAAESFQPPDVKPGLWETATTSEVSGAPMIPPEALAHLTPEQRAKIEAARKARQARGPQARTHQTCMTKEKLSKPLTFGENQESCKMTVLASSRNKQEIHSECATEFGKSSSEIRFEAPNSENIKGTTLMTMTSEGRTTTINVNFTSKWIGSSCGDVK